ncbi:MAG: ABC transporter permease subunit, partial [Solimonas sp.]
MKSVPFWGALVALLAAGLMLTEMVENEYYFNALYVVLQAMLMAIAWNILGGFTGYVNFGSAGFFAVGAYTTVVLQKAFSLPLPLLILSAALVCGLIGFGLGYLTLRLKG